MKFAKQQAVLQLTIWVGLLACVGVSVAMPITSTMSMHAPAATFNLPTGTGTSQSEPIALLQRQRRQTSAKSNKKTKAFEQECLAVHNKWRRLHQANDLIFDKKITAFAQKRADFIAASDGDEFRHPNDLPYGENLAWHSRPTTSCSDLIKMWYDEVELYNFRLGRFDHETGHFTQLVWRNTERVGCARAFSSGPKGGIYLVCNYDPPGNFLGEAVENVLVRRSPLKPMGQPTIVSLPTTTSTQRSTTALAVTAPPQVATTGPVTSTTSGGIATTSKPSLDKRDKLDEDGKRKKKGKKNKKGKKKNKKGKKKNKNKNKPATTATTTTSPSLNLVPSPASNSTPNSLG